MKRIWGTMALLILALLVLWASGCGQNSKPAEKQAAKEPSAAPAQPAQEKPKIDYPNKQVTIIVPNKPGASVDVVTRAFQPYLQEQLKEAVVAQNEDGSSGGVARKIVYQAKPDGYTLLTSSWNAVLHVAVNQDKEAYKEDFVDAFIPIGAFLSGDGNIVNVPKNSSINSWADFVAEAKKRTLNLGVAGSIGSSDHLTALIINRDVGIKTNIVPYPSSGELGVALAGGHVDAGILGMSGAGFDPAKMKPLAVTLPDRSQLIPNVPTFKELGFPQVDLGWKNGLFAPLKTPPEVISILEKAVEKAFNADGYQKWAKDANKPLGRYINAKDFTDMLKSYTKRAKEAVPMMQEDVKRIQEGSSGSTKK